MDTFELITRLVGIHGPSGRETGVAEAIAELAGPYADEITTDVLGNLIVHKKGPGPKVMFAAHTDSIGLVASHIEEDGSIRVGRVGGVRPGAIKNMPIRFSGGVMGTVRVHGKADDKDPAIDDLYLDIGAANREEAQSKVRPGDMAVYATAPFRAGNSIVTPYLDNRVSCAILLKALEQVRTSENDLYFVFTVQEEVGVRGAKTAAYAVDPDYGIALDVTIAADTPGAKKISSVVMGGGAAIKVMDNSLIAHSAMIDMLEQLGREKGIKTQREVLTAGGTDAGAIHQSRTGVVTGAISIPCRYVHTPLEMADLSDIESCIALVTAFAESKLK